jgi:hypothetical protein
MIDGWILERRYLAQRKPMFGCAHARSIGKRVTVLAAYAE